MSCDVCRTCKNAGDCTFPRSKGITECDEYRNNDEAPAFDWDLQEMLDQWWKKDATKGILKSTE